MTIKPLSDHTARVLTSTQTLHNAVSVIKELVDNALDACALSISIEISSNTIDKLVVRDDGTGIGVEDRRMLCKRGCTSKITNLDDLAKLGGTFLGFRGTALASVAELSRSVTVVTRVDGEQPATTLTFGSGGELLSSASASHNVGTTVRVESFLTSVPVRKQTATKNCAKILDQIKRLLYSYALARPTVKLSLKVLKAKNDRANWSFAACRQGSQLLTAATQVIGKTTADLCGSYSATSNEDEATAFKIDALILKSDTKDLAECSNTGQFVSIDGRPVSQEKGVVKEIVKLYKLYLHNSIQGSGRIPAKPFLVAHIYCPSGSYDVNIEPAKDIVLFHDPSKVIDVARKIFTDAYGELPVSPMEEKTRPIEVRSRDNASSFDVLLARKKPGSDVEVTGGTSTIDLESAPTISRAETLLSNFAQAMKDAPATRPIGQDRFNGNNDDFEKSHYSLTNPCQTMSSADDGTITEGFQDELRAETEEDESYDPNSAILNNPFIRAKLTSSKNPMRPPHAVDSRYHGTRDVNVAASSTSSSPPALSLFNNRDASRQSIHLPTPSASPQNTDCYQNPGPPFPRRSRNNHDDGDDVTARSVLPFSPLHSVEQQSSLGSWVQRGTGDRGSPDRIDVPPVNQQGEGSQRGVSAKMYKPFRSPVKQPQSTLQQGIQPNLVGGPDQRPTNVARSREDIYSSTQSDADLQNILAFEWQKRALKQQQKNERQRLELRTSRDVQHQQSIKSLTTNSAAPRTLSPAKAPSLVAYSSSSPRANLATKLGTIEAESPPSTQTPNPHRNRYLAAVRSLESRESNDALASSTKHDRNNDDTVESDRGLMSSDDPRHYLIQIQKRNRDANRSHLQVKKVHSSKLPLETIESAEMKHRILAIPTGSFPSTELLQSTSRTLSAVDTYVKKGGVWSVHWSPVSKDIEQWQDRLTALVGEHYSANVDTIADDGEIAAQLLPNFEISLARVIRAHIDSTETDENIYATTNTEA